MATQIQIRRDLGSNWTSVNPTLAQGEMGLETDTNKFKFGTGTQSWTELPYAISGGGSGTSGTAGTSGSSGTSGESGTSGLDGTSGTSGESGTSGIDGTAGTSGESGTSGIDGTAGTSGVSGSYTYITEVESTLDLIIPDDIGGVITIKTDSGTQNSSVYVAVDGLYLTGTNEAGTSYTELNVSQGSMYIDNINPSIPLDGFAKDNNLTMGSEGVKIKTILSNNREDGLAISPDVLGITGLYTKPLDGSGATFGTAQIVVGNSDTTGGSATLLAYDLSSNFSSISLTGEKSRVASQGSSSAAVDVYNDGTVIVGAPNGFTVRDAVDGIDGVTYPSSGGADGQFLGNFGGTIAFGDVSVSPPSTILATSSNTDYVTMVYEDETASFIIKKSNLFAISPTQQAIIADYAAESNIGLAIIPKGNGALTTAIPDGTDDNGDPRGQYAVDLQLKRFHYYDVAGGNYSNILGGFSSRATGIASTVLGGYNTAVTGNYATGKSDDGSITGEWSVGIGRYLSITGLYSFSHGWSNDASGWYSLSFGQSSGALHDKSFVSGQYGKSANIGEMVRSTTYISVGADAQNSSLQLAKGASLTASQTMVLNIMSAEGVGTNDIALYEDNRSVTGKIVWTAICSVSSGELTDPSVGDTVGGESYILYKKVGGTLTKVSENTVWASVGDASVNTATLTTAVESNKIRLTFTAPTTTESANTYKVSATITLNQVAW